MKYDTAVVSHVFSYCCRLVCLISCTPYYVSYIHACMSMLKEQIRRIALDPYVRSLLPRTEDHPPWRHGGGTHGSEASAATLVSFAYCNDDCIIVCMHVPFFPRNHWQCYAFFCTIATTASVYTLICNNKSKMRPRSDYGYVRTRMCGFLVSRSPGLIECCVLCSMLMFFSHTRRKSWMSVFL